MLYIPFYLSIYLSVYLPIFLSIYLSIYLFTYTYRYRYITVKSHNIPVYRIPRNPGGLAFLTLPMARKIGTVCKPRRRTRPWEISQVAGKSWGNYTIENIMLYFTLSPYGLHTFTICLLYYYIYCYNVFGGLSYPVWWTHSLRTWKWRFRPIEHGDSP